MLEGLLDELTHGVALARGQDEVIGGVVLQHHPHAADIITGMSPITLGVQVALKEGREGGREGGVNNQTKQQQNANASDRETNAYRSGREEGGSTYRGTRSSAGPSGYGQRRG